MNPRLASKATCPARAKRCIEGVQPGPESRYQIIYGTMPMYAVERVLSLYAIQINRTGD